MLDATEDLITGPRSLNNRADTDRRLQITAQYGASLLLVATATVLAFLASHLVAAPNLTLIFVIPVVIAATSFGLGPSVAAIAASILAFDFFFTQPYFTLRMTEPSEIWAAGLLLVTAAIVSAVAGQSRRRALESHRAAEQAEALRALAHAVIEGRPQHELAQAAAMALSRIFAAPAALFAELDGRLHLEAASGGAVISELDIAAAENALNLRAHVRGETYPNDSSKFDFWPIATPTSCRYVLGVDFRASAFERPADPERFVEIVAAYVASKLEIPAP